MILEPDIFSGTITGKPRASGDDPGATELAWPDAA